VEIDTNVNQQLFEKFVDGYKDYLQEKETKLALQKFNQLRVLCATREGPQGLYATNTAIENYLHKHYKLDKRQDFYHNRPIIVTKNYPELKLFNGDIGIIRKDDNGNMRAWFEDSDKNIRSVLPGYIDSAETVFAMTIHKSQGSEYKEVLVLLPQNTGNQLLTRELLYTAVTRAKEKVLVQASEAVLMETAEAAVERASGIINRFEEI
jgi:exodeoxyribonuclease V alpha subunit